MDDQGARLAKRHDALSLRALRARGITPEELRTQADEEVISGAQS
jgi:glutamyl-tRNA synthetase